MPLTNFSDKVTAITHTWLNKIDVLYVTLFGEATTSNALLTTLTATRSETGAVAVPVLNKLRETASVKDFGAVGNGVANDTAAIQAAHDSFGASGGCLYFPTGNYLVSTINITKPSLLLGSGTSASIITALNATGNILNITAEKTTIRSIGFSSAVTRTSGAYVHFNTGGNQGQLTDFFMTGQYIGVQITAAATVRVNQGSIRSGATSAGSAGILIDGGNDHFIDSITMDAAAASQPAAGIQITQSGATLISNVDIIHHTNCLLINPSSGLDVASVFAINSYFDTAVRGILINPSGTGIVIRCRFVGCWTSSHTEQGVLIANNGTGTMDGFEFIGHHCFLNASNGFLVNNGNTLPLNTNVLGGAFAQNTGHGIVFAGGITNFSVVGARVGSGYGLTGNTVNGILVETGASNNYRILDNDVRGNTSAGINDIGTGTTKLIANNLGHNPVGSTGLTVTASPFTYTNNTGGLIMVQINSGTVSNVTVNGNIVGAATNIMVSLPQNQSVVVTYSAAPNMLYLGS